MIPHYNPPWPDKEHYNQLMLKCMTRSACGCTATKSSRNLYLQHSKGNYSKLYIQELWFLHSACHPMLVNSSMKFHERFESGHNFVTETATYTVQRGITLQIYYGSCALHIV